MARELTTAEQDALWMRAVGLYPGAPLPHPSDCGCSQHTARAGAIGGHSAGALASFAAAARKELDRIALGNHPLSGVAAIPSTEGPQAREVAAGNRPRLP